jgi:GMP synthase (glutamine-hydrolysing)
VSEVVVIEHTRGAGVSAFAEVLDGRAASIAPWRVVDVPGGDQLPGTLDDVAGILVMGGTMSAVDPAAHAWMGPELELLRRAVDAEVPVLGVCLGAQLLAQAHGGEVAQREVPEIAYLPLDRTDEGRRDAVVQGWPDGAATLFLHEDEVTRLPEGAEVLMRGSDGVPAWRLGSAVAVQFHPEVTPDQLATWVGRGLLTDLFERAGVDGDALLAEAERRGTVAVPQGRALVGRWLDGPVRRRVELQTA